MTPRDDQDDEEQQANEPKAPAPSPASIHAPAIIGFIDVRLRRARLGDDMIGAAAFVQAALFVGPKRIGPLHRVDLIADAPNKDSWPCLPSRSATAG